MESAGGEGEDDRQRQYQRGLREYVFKALPQSAMMSLVCHNKGMGSGWGAGEMYNSIEKQTHHYASQHHNMSIVFPMIQRSDNTQQKGNVLCWQRFDPCDDKNVNA